MTPEQKPVELLACQFCETPLVKLDKSNDGRDRSFVRCSSCGAQGPLAGHPIRAAELWNTRASDRWIKCSERLPEGLNGPLPDSTRYVWVWVRKEQRGIDMCWRHIEGLGKFNGHWQERHSPNAYYPENGADLWQELPTPPRE